MLGDLSARYESNGDPGAISSGYGDLGGVSYGCYQLASNTGSVQSFLRWLKDIGHTYGNSLGSLEPCTGLFNQVWRDIARVDSAGFKALQHDYIAYAYYEPAVVLLRDNYFCVEKHSEIMKDVIWSRTVQYGTGCIVELFEAAAGLGHPNLSYIDDARFDYDLIASIYDYLIEECDKAYPLSSGLYHSPNDWANGSYDVVKIGLRNRFAYEKDTALDMI